MTNRERLIKVFQGQPVDRVPISPWVYNNFIYEFFDVVPANIDEFLNPTNFDLNQKTIEVFEYFGFDLIHRLGSIWEHLNEVSDNDKWIVQRKEESAGTKITETTIIRTPERELRQVKEIKHSSKYLFVEAIVEYFIKTQEDFEQFLKYQPREVKLDCSRLTRTRQLVGDKGLVLACVHGAYNYLNMYRRLDDIMMDPYLDEGLYREMIKYFSERLFMLSKQFVDAGADIINLAINMANGSSVGLDYFKKYVLEYETELNKKLKQAGALVHNHNCGDARNLLDIYRELPMDAYESLTPPPYGDTIFEEALERFSPHVALFGNIDQVDFLMKATPEEVRKKVKEVVLKGKQRGNFVLSTTDWFFDGTPYGNIKAMVEAGLEYGKY